MHIVKKDDDAEPTAIEVLAMDLSDLQDDVIELRNRLGGGRRPSEERLREERAERWERMLALLKAAFGGAQGEMKYQEQVQRELRKRSADGL
jgi:hypothetical protein